MRNSHREDETTVSPLIINVSETPQKHQSGVVQCLFGENINFSLNGIQSYFFADWNPRLFDALIVAGAVEFADRIQRRPTAKWTRHFEIRIPVHEPDLWNRSVFNHALVDCIQFLTGDEWSFRFYSRKRAFDRPNQISIPLEPEVEAVLPFSDGLDSFVVSRIFERSLGNRLVKVRLGSLPRAHSLAHLNTLPFNRIPFRIARGTHRFVESSARSRGFKFLLMAGIAASLAKAKSVIVPESGQGVLAPVLVPVGQVYEDFRNHPLFTRRLEYFLGLLLEDDIRFVFPQLWKTKGESILQWLESEQSNFDQWIITRSCWQQNRQVTVNERYRQCGVCAACMLRRLAIFSAGIADYNSTYACENLRASELRDGFASGFDKNRITSAMREYALAGSLHLEDFAILPQTTSWESLRLLHSQQLSKCLGIMVADAMSYLDRLLLKHRTEWAQFKYDLGPTSFVNKWIGDMNS